MLYKFQDLFQLENSLIVTSGLECSLQIVMFTKNKTEKVVKLSNHSELITVRFLPESVKSGVYSLADICLFRGGMMPDENFLMNDLLHVTRADRIVFEESIAVKDNALIDTILGNPAVKDAAVYKNDISG